MQMMPLIRQRCKNGLKITILKKKTLINNKLVHKTQSCNNFIARLEKLSDGPEEMFISQLNLNPTHPYFFEHTYDHVPGLMIIEAGRQTGTAIAHVFYNVSFDTFFILEEVNVKFIRYVSLDAPVFTKSIMRNKVVKNGQLRQMDLDGVFIQNGEEVAEMRGTWKIISQKIFNHLRKSTLR